MVKHKEPTIRKQEIVDYAMHLFLKQGYEKTSVSQIAKAVDVAKGLVYYYFESKEEILECVVEDMCQQHVERLMIQIDEHANDFYDRLLLLMDAYYEIHPYTETESSTRWFMQNAFVETFHKIYLQRIDNVLTQIVEQGQKDGYFELQYPKMMIIMTLEGIFGLSRYRQITRDQVVEMIEQSLNLPRHSLKEKGASLLTHFVN
ncbi:TetR/AcrR family transcriptional regulator [Erysipelothrix sp. HDW6C]|uniref:TetR/AcrR family transcriptional regulator n=1 Tax=Erysipelothrix sp. HDW6C TaxID=2714930 RepID=UPI00140AF819|nr:TetR/AcrR family transcriptional regulator [Erysipelothrix sp. HDW6C]QIK69846.1 TetR/AcrR family transcriptional regulator [Erysipelothrix sp. HDW6C]